MLKIYKINTIMFWNKGGTMKKLFFTMLSVVGMILMFTMEVSANSVLSKISTIVIIFTSIAGVAIWLYAMKKRKELDE